ncbi:hypothetical protein [Tropicimonas isoalkanivorans]|uniref:Uncharacterized protein n=1 Tax=Tropicimonas isoalkanivorans TaxID=441112 RepID=A0A1I1N741_9RHOB|nr:hypothetical protein [Tropicimonas isoalkanivorans]SFC93022.1 hypothetical protein SAMN04488094_111151 [Tropicimonas isoalkanivorans]
MTGGSADTPGGWEGILEPGETVLWQGRPRPGVSFTGFDLRRTLFGLVFLGFALFWVVGAAHATGDAPLPVRILFPAAGFLFVFQGARLAGGDRLWRAWVRRGTWYTLTSQQALIATEVFGRRGLDAWPITGRNAIELVEGSPGSIFFADTGGPFGRGRRIGFERIDDAREVLALMRRVQRGAA